MPDSKTIPASGSVEVRTTHLAELQNTSSAGKSGNHFNSEIPSVNFPKGGAIKSIDEKF